MGMTPFRSSVWRGCLTQQIRAEIFTTRTERQKNFEEEKKREGEKKTKHQEPSGLYCRIGYC